MNDDKETRIKTLIWEHANQDYIQQQQFMEKLRAENPSEFKKRYPWKVASEKKASKRTKTEPTDLVEAAGRVLESRYGCHFLRQHTHPCFEFGLTYKAWVP